MRRILPTIALLGILSLASVPAQAHDSWLGIGAQFRVGGSFFSLVFGTPGYSYPRGLYYRTGYLIPAHGLRCGSSCFHSGGLYYHGADCPLVRSHFLRLGYDPFDVLVRYAPRGYAPRYNNGYASGYGSGYGNGYGSGYGSAYGYGNSYGYGSRYGNGYNYNNNYGYGSGYNNYGNGYGNGYGYGHRSGRGDDRHFDRRDDRRDDRHHDWRSGRETNGMGFNQHDGRRDGDRDGDRHRDGGSRRDNNRYDSGSGRHHGSNSPRR